MLNNRSMFLPDDLSHEFSTLFQGGDERASLDFLWKYLQFIESDESPYNRLFFLENPLARRERDRALMKELNVRIHRFIECLARAGRRVAKRSYTDAEVACYLGVAYEYGLFGVPRSSEQAFRYYTLATQLRSCLGTLRLGLCYERGFGTAPDAAKAVYFFRCAAKYGHPAGMHIYGSILAHGHLGTEPNVTTGLHFLALASLRADKTYPYALYDLGTWYEDASKVHYILPDSSYAFRLYVRGAKLGEPNSQFRLGRAYARGELGQPQNVARAVQLYRLAARNGHIDAQLCLSEVLFAGGDGVAQNPQEAYLWAVRAGSKGSGRGAYTVAEYALRGCGVRRDPLLAWWWFIISYELGHKEAGPRMRALAREITHIDEGPFRPTRCFGLCLPCLL